MVKEEKIIDSYPILICTVNGCIHEKDCSERHGSRSYDPRTEVREERDCINRVCKSFEKDGGVN